MNDDRADEILDAIHAFAENTDKQFAEVRAAISDLQTTTARLEVRTTRLEATVVTKEYLDDKLIDLRAGIMSADKKVDQHVDAVVDVLADNGTIAPEQAKQLMAMEPFPKLSV